MWQGEITVRRNKIHLNSLLILVFCYMAVAVEYWYTASDKYKFNFIRCLFQQSSRSVGILLFR